MCRMKPHVGSAQNVRRLNAFCALRDLKASLCTKVKLFQNVSDFLMKILEENDIKSAQRKRQIAPALSFASVDGESDTGNRRQSGLVRCWMQVSSAFYAV